LEAARAVEADGPIPVDQAVLFAQDDVDDVEGLLDADVVVSFTSEPRSGATRGGRHVEFGIALALRFFGKGVPRLYIVGPLENVFHAPPEVDRRFDEWDGFLAHLDAQAKADWTDLRVADARERSGSSGVVNVSVVARKSRYFGR